MNLPVLQCHLLWMTNLSETIQCLCSWGNQSFNSNQHRIFGLYGVTYIKFHYHIQALIKMSQIISFRYGSNSALCFPSTALWNYTGFHQIGEMLTKSSSTNIWLRTPKRKIISRTTVGFLVGFCLFVVSTQVNVSLAANIFIGVWSNSFCHKSQKWQLRSISGERSSKEKPSFPVMTIELFHSTESYKLIEHF